MNAWAKRHGTYIMAAYDCCREATAFKTAKRGLGDEVKRWNDGNNMFVTYGQKPTSGKFNLMSKFQQNYTFVLTQYVKEHGGVLFMPHALDTIN